MTERIRFQRGDIVTRDGSDRQRVLSVSDSWETVEVECIREPLGVVGLDLVTRGEPWCRLGDVDVFMADHLDFADEPVDGRPSLRLGTNPQD